MNYREALDYIYSFTNFEVTPAGSYTSKTFDLTRMERLLEALGNPHHRFQSVHIAGTKGKGSTAALTESILRSAGHVTGFYTSPHLHTFRERIQVNGQLISRALVAKGIAKIRPLADQIAGLTTFEVMTALAFDHFAAHNVEIAVLEVGLGGRLDATNVVAPTVCAITSISYDHVAILGNTLTEIATEKAGIIKPNIPVVSAPQTDEASAVVERIAQDRAAPLVAITPDLSFRVAAVKYQVIPDNQDLDGQSFIWLTVRDANLELVSCNMPLLGQHQLVNAATSIALALLMREQSVSIPNESIRDGIAQVQWPGRFEILGRSPFVIVDGAHNADSARQLLQTLRDYFPSSGLHFIFGASNDKDVPGMFTELLPSAESLILTRSHNPRAADLARLAEIAQPFNVEVSMASDLTTALKQARDRAETNDVICVTGSLFVVAEARSAWFAEHGQLTETDAG